MLHQMLVMASLLFGHARDISYGRAIYFGIQELANLWLHTVLFNQFIHCVIPIYLRRVTPATASWMYT